MEPLAAVTVISHSPMPAISSTEIPRLVVDVTPGEKAGTYVAERSDTESVRSYAAPDESVLYQSKTFVTGPGAPPPIQTPPPAPVHVAVLPAVYVSCQPGTLIRQHTSYNILIYPIEC